MSTRCAALLLCVAASALPAGAQRSRPMIADRVPEAAVPFPLSDVRLTGGPFKHAQDLDAAYLLSLEPDRLLAWFRKEAGLKPKAEVYGGWESQGVAGHSLGHYLSACSRMYAATGDARFRDRVAYIVGEMDACQKANGDGYVAAIPNGKEIFARVAKGDVTSQGFDLNGGWVPWYTLHKELAGLIDAYQYCGDQDALRVARGLADWARAVTENLSETVFQRMLACEHGGMNEALANLYAITGDSRYLSLAQRFNHRAVLDPLGAREDPLTGLHANTQIPKLIGAARQYELTGDPRLKTMASFFWSDVTGQRSWVIGGNSEAEHFPPPGEMSKRLSPTTAETCNTYNMLKLTRHLFTWEPKAAYGDFMERALYNHILASQNPETGMMCYYVPLKTGVPKAFNTPTDSFWCCTGTGMENHARYGEYIYFRGADGGLIVNLFAPSELRWREKGVTVRQSTAYPSEGVARLTFSAARPVKLSVTIRHPWWAVDGATASVNGRRVAASGRPGSFYTVTRTWKDGDTLTVKMPMRVRAEPMRDDPNTVAFLYGPLVLAAPLPVGGTNSAVVGEPSKLASAVQRVPGDSLRFSGAAGVFRASGEAKRDVELEPFYRVYREPYAVYFRAFDRAGWARWKAEFEQEQLRRIALEARTVDSFQPGEMQPERDHDFQGEKVRTGENMGLKWRDAPDGGWFSFSLKCDPATGNELRCLYWGSDAGGRTFDILVDGTRLATVSLNGEHPNEFYEAQYKLPLDLTKDKERVTVTFRAHPGEIAGGLYGCRMLRVNQPLVM